MVVRKRRAPPRLSDESFNRADGFFDVHHVHHSLSEAQVKRVKNTLAESVQRMGSQPVKSFLEKGFDVQSIRHFSELVHQDFCNSGNLFDALKLWNDFVEESGLHSALPDEQKEMRKNAFLETAGKTMHALSGGAAHVKAVLKLGLNPLKTIALQDLPYLAFVRKQYDEDRLKKVCSILDF